MFDQKSKMQVNDINNRDKIAVLIINELKDIGVKYRKDKKSKFVQSKVCRKRIFQTDLHLLEQTDVILANGCVVQIPKFVADACNRILEHVETEGIFRKAGSSIRQKEIRISLEAGMSLGKAHHVIDVANVVKSFFRELPEPLIPPSIQETLLRSLLIGEDYIKAILLTCLLLPPIKVNTLSFFMQFLQTVSLSSHLNKMSSENLAIIFTPGLMPFSGINSHRFNNHVKTVQLLIDNANSIGTIPKYIIDKIDIHDIHRSPYQPPSFGEAEAIQKKKKRRSGSLSHMFNGIRKMVGSTKGSSENLENTPDNKCVSYPFDIDKVQQTVATPSLKSTKKRKFTEPVCAFSAKKKKDLLALLPNNSGGLFPNTPQIKDVKKSRLSLGGRREMKNMSNNVVVTSMERRWSIVGSGWSKKKTKCFNGIKNEEEINEENIKISSKHLSPIISMPNSEFTVGNTRFTNRVSQNYCTDMFDDYVRISKHECEAMKERVAKIETRISEEFGDLQNSSTNTSISSIYEELKGPKRVFNKYKKITENTLSSHITDELAQRLSYGLKIRRSSEHRVIRSPSERKIGTIRKRSQEKVRLSRNPTWHISSTTKKASINLNNDLTIEAPQNCFYAKSNLKRGRPNTLNTGLLNQHCALSIDINREYNKDQENNDFHEQWTDGQSFFFDSASIDIKSKHHNNFFNFEEKAIKKVNKIYKHHDNRSTPRNESISTPDKLITPMCPPKSNPRKMSSIRTPNATIKTTSGTKKSLAKALHISTSIDEEINGRASIARLRAQNAGMVLAKAKLFDGLGAKYSNDVDIDNAIHILNPENNCEENLYTKSISCEANEGQLKRSSLTENKSLPCKISVSDPKIQKILLTPRCSKLNILNVKENHSNIESRNFRHNINQKIGRSPNNPRSQKQILPNTPHRILNKAVVANASRIRTPLKMNAQVSQRNTPRFPKTKLSGKCHK